jgi:hypothetical protein
MVRMQPDQRGGKPSFDRMDATSIHAVRARRRKRIVLERCNKIHETVLKRGLGGREP